MRKQVTVEINDSRPSIGQHHEKPVAPVRVFISLDADTIQHAIADLQSAHVEALMQFEAHQERTGRAGTTPTDATASPNPVYRDIRDAAARARSATVAPDINVQLRPDDDGDDAA